MNQDQQVDLLEQEAAPIQAQEHPVTISQEEVTEFSNEKLRSQLKYLSQARVSCDLEIAPPLVDASYQTALKKVNKQVSIPGFRKGKAPEALLRKHYSKYVDQYWREELISTALEENALLTRVLPCSRKVSPTVNLGEIVLGKSALLTVSFNTFPKVPPIDIPDLLKDFSEKPLEIKPPTEKEVDTYIRQMRYNIAKWEDITDRPVEEGDFVLLDVEVLEKEPREFLYQGKRFEVTLQDMPEWLHSLVLGLSPGENKEGMTAPEEEEKQAEFSPQKVQVSIKAIQKCLFPSLEMLPTFLACSSLEEMRERVRKTNLLSSEWEAKETLRNKLVEHLQKRYPLEIPTELLQEEVFSRLPEYLKDQFSIQEWNALSEKEKEDHIGHLAFLSRTALHLFFLSEKIGEQENLQISEADFSKPLTFNELVVQELMGIPSKPDNKSTSAYLIRKVLDFLLEKAGLYPATPSS